MTQFISKIFDSVEYPTQSIYYFSISFPVIKVERKKESLEDRNLFQKSNIKLLIDRCSKMLTVRIKYNCCTSILHSESRTPLYTTEFSSFSGEANVPWFFLLLKQQGRTVLWGNRSWKPYAKSILEIYECKQKCYLELQM